MCIRDSQHIAAGRAAFPGEATEVLPGKAVDREMVIGAIRLVLKSGGKSGTFQREGEGSWVKL